MTAGAGGADRPDRGRSKRQAPLARVLLFSTDMMNTTVVTMEPAAADAIVQKLADGGTRPDAELGVCARRSAAETRFGHHFRTTREVLGKQPVTVYGAALGTDAQARSESLGDTLFRHGFDGQIAEDIERELEAGRVLMFMPRRLMDVSGLRIQAEREPGLHVFASNAPRAPVGTEDAGEGSIRRSSGAALYADES